MSVLLRRKAARPWLTVLPAPTGPAPSAPAPTARAAADPTPDDAPVPVRLNGAQLRRIARGLAARPGLLELAAASADPTARTWTSLDAGADAVAWLIHWPAGTSTGWHDHGDDDGGVAGAFVVLDGELVEQLWSAHGPLRRRIGPFLVRSFGRSHVHDVGAQGPGPAVSVHVYSPRLTSMRRYDLVGERLVSRPAGADAAAAGAW